MKKPYRDPYQTTAKFNSTCPHCKEIIPKGVNIVYDPNEKKAYHLACGQDILDGLRAEKSMDEFGTDIY